MGFGSGLALDSKFPQQNFARDYYQQSQRKKSGKEKAVAQEAKDSDKYLNSIQVELGKGKFHPVYFEDAQSTMKDVLSAAEQAQAESAQTGQNWKANTNFQMKLAEARNKVQQLRSLSDNQYTQEDQIVTDLQAGTGDSETGMNFLQNSRAGNKKALEQSQDPYGYVNSSKTPIGGFYSSSVQPYQKIDLPKLIHDDLTSPKNMTWVQNIKNNQGLPGNVRGMLSESGLPNTESEAKVLQKKLGYSEQPTSVESIVNAKVEDHYREMEKLVRSDAISLADKAGKDFSKLPIDERKDYVKEAALARAIPQKGMKITEKTFTMPRPTQTEKDKEWQSEGTTFSNAKNAITVTQIGQTDIPQLVNMPQLANNPNLKVYSFSHKDVMENKPLILTDAKGQPQNGIFKGVIMDDKKPENSLLIMAVNSAESPTGLQYVTLPYTAANKDVIKNEYGKDAEDALRALGGKTGTTTDSGVSSTHKSSGKSGKNFATLPIVDRQSLLTKSGAKTKKEFASWLDVNGYIY